MAKGSFTSLRARALAALLLPAVLLPVAPAHAGGALIAGDGRRAAVTREVSVVRWDGAREQIVTRLTVSGDAPDAAWLMPVPARASVELGDPALLDGITAATTPSYRTRPHFWPQDGDWPFTSGGRPPGPPPPERRPDGGAGVGLVAGERLGPFDVAHLSAADPAALAAWLRANGYTLPPGLQDALRPYVALRWQYVAIKLSPAAYGALDGVLDPLHVSFATEAPVYPVRLASTPASLSLYVLADHRMEPASAVGGSRPRVTYAGRVPADSGALSTFARATPYLTAIAQDLPARVTADHTLRRASTDAPVRQTVYADRLRTLAGIPAWLLAVTAVILVLAASAIHVAVRGNRTRKGSHAGESATPSEGSTPEMTGTPEETLLNGLTARVSEALEALRARVTGGGGPRAGGIPPMPQEPPTVGAGGVPPMPRSAPDSGVPPMPGVAPAFPEVPPVPLVAPRVPPMPRVPPVPSHAPPGSPSPTTDGGTAHLFGSPGDVPRVSASAGLHKYPFCAPPLNQGAFGSRQKHRRAQQVPRQSSGTV
ncbi:DUF2330 domain-containing protein [Streptomyces sp. 4F14]|uniref:DUF2330 domain-containing protein n=1 Tax=Streptomyces sp. 4F14 TaxID=3394380 RepID=UPI003A88F78E